MRLVEIDAERASDKGISVGEGSVVDARQLRISDGRIAIAVKDGSIVRIEGCHLTGNEYGILRYIKKPIYTYPDLHVRDCDYSKNAVARRDEPDTIWTRRYD